MDWMVGIHILVIKVKVSRIIAIIGFKAEKWVINMIIVMDDMITIV